MQFIFSEGKGWCGGLVVVICCVWYARKDATPGLFWWCVSGKAEELRGAVEVFEQSAGLFLPRKLAPHLIHHPGHRLIQKFLSI